ncbi:MAG: helix-turn-helix domain-containing protein, partial [Phycisphaerae bacterium]|nr:helix-turn-helix domain-containing protein [Phycisphaerae bacterium]
MHGCHLTIDDREVIAELIAARRSQAAVAERLGCSRSTISRELGPYGSYDRNRSPDGSYRPSRAQAAQRHRRTSKRPWKLETTAEALAEVAEDEEAGEHISEDRL